MKRRSSVWVRPVVYGAAALVVIGAVYIGAVRQPALYTEHTAKSQAEGLLQMTAHKLRERAAEGQAVLDLTPGDVLDLPESTDQYGNRYSIEWHGSAPEFEGTRIVCARNGEVTSTLTVMSLHDARWSTESTPTPAWWEVWR